MERPSHVDDTRWIEFADVKEGIRRERERERAKESEEHGSEKPRCLLNLLSHTSSKKLAAGGGGATAPLVACGVRFLRRQSEKQLQATSRLPKKTIELVELLATS